MIAFVNRLYNRFYSALVVLFGRRVILLQELPRERKGTPVTIWHTLEDDEELLKLLRLALEKLAQANDAAGKSPSIICPSPGKN